MNSLNLKGDLKSFLLECHLTPSVTILVWTVNICRKRRWGPISVAINHSLRICLRFKLRRSGSAEIGHILSTSGAPIKLCLLNDTYKQLK